jgi:hypothetical protein
MPIKARPFKTQVGEVDVEGFFKDDSFVFRFYGLVEFQPPVSNIDEDVWGTFAVIEEIEISHPDGFVLKVETNYDSDLGAEWGYQVSLRRNENQDPNISTPPRQLTSVFFNPRGVMDGSAQLEPLEGGTDTHDPKTARIEDRVRSSGDQRILFLSHAVRQMSRPDRMIKRLEVRNVIETGVVIEEYPEDPRGPSCLILGHGMGKSPHSCSLLA